jgi:hypothetical protein
VRLESRHNQHWPAKSTEVRCRVCSSRGERKNSVYKCAKWDVVLCVVPCFGDYHTKVNFWPFRIHNSVGCGKILSQGATDLLQQPEFCE